MFTSMLAPVWENPNPNVLLSVGHPATRLPSQERCIALGIGATARGEVRAFWLGRGHFCRYDVLSPRGAEEGEMPAKSRLLRRSFMG